MTFLSALFPKKTPKFAKQTQSKAPAKSCEEQPSEKVNGELPDDEMDGDVCSEDALD